MTPARLKLTAILGAILGGGLAMLSWSQTWFELHLVAGAGGDGTAIAVSGQLASPALAALGLAALALSAALALAGPGLRIVLGALEFLLGGCVVLAASLTLADPVAAVAPAVTEATGVAGAEPTAALVAGVDASLWPLAAFAGGALLVVSALLVFVTGAKWPASSSRYGGAKLRQDGAAAPVSSRDRAVEEWDELTRGDDPTEESEPPAGAAAEPEDHPDRPTARGDEPGAADR
ncbi:Trp biosynthesis-associated membrane protein [Agromyces soli]|uniref:Trp biosynthesis-associated membrane protein n=1 Tax=Agromyces soli TaxID=659012 RepID=A0ABY4AR82_9MICO|nr:Trp biosynthesis-associated membrane protein [Agromyces soli]UOE25369.1 Trp biosynthesis-associated membrane protein [Agromyces soli]